MRTRTTTKATKEQAAALLILAHAGSHVLQNGDHDAFSEINWAFRLVRDEIKGRKASITGLPHTKHSTLLRSL